MHRVPVNSSNVAEVGYDVESMTLEVAFRNGSTYQYFDVPENIYKGLLRAKSVGTYLSQEVKEAYRYKRI